MSSVLIAGTHDGIGGVARIQVSLTRELRQRGWCARLAYPATTESAPLFDWCRHQGVEAESGPESLHVFVPHSLRRMRETARYLRAVDARNVNLHYGAAYISPKDALAVRLSGRRRLIVSVHGTRASRRQLRMTALAARFCDVIVVVSAWSREQLLTAGVPPRKIELIPNGLARPERYPDRQEARERLGLPPDAFIIATMARLTPEKGVDDLIEAVAFLPDPENTLRLVVAGDGPEREHLERLAEQRLPGRAFFPGHCNEVADLYAGADVFALTSHAESFGLVFIEAAFFGVPVVGTNVEGVPSAVSDGETGLLVPPKAPHAAAEAIQRLRDEPGLRERMGRAARARALEEFTSEKMADRYMNILCREGHGIADER